MKKILALALTLTMLLNRRDSLNIAQACHFEAINEGLIEVGPYEARLTAARKALNNYLKYLDQLDENADL